MADEDPHVAIGRLRWPVTLASREQAANAQGGITETLTGSVTVYADIQAVGALTFWATGAYEQTDTPITHRIFMRWHDYLDQTKAVIRETARPDGTTRTEVFRVRRIKELGGRKRFVVIEAQLEQVPT